MPQAPNPLQFAISSAESQKGIIAAQTCSFENQKGTITIDFVQRYIGSNPSGSQRGSSLNNVPALLALNGRCDSGAVHKGPWITFRKPFRIVILTLSWYESLIFSFVKAKLFQIRLFKCEKIVFWITVCLESLILRTCECKALSERDPCVRIVEMRAEAMHGSISAVGTKYYLAVRRSCSWSGRRLQCLRTHVVQITNPIRKRVVIRNGFQNVIRSFGIRPRENLFFCPWDYMYIKVWIFDFFSPDFPVMSLAARFWHLRTAIVILPAVGA